MVGNIVSRPYRNDEKTNKREKSEYKPISTRRVERFRDGSREQNVSVERFRKLPGLRSYPGQLLGNHTPCLITREYGEL